MGVIKRRIGINRDAKRIPSLKSVSLKILIPVCVVLLGLMTGLIWGINEDWKLANKYIEDTAGLYVEQINKNISQINLELIYILNYDENIAQLPNEMSPWDGKYYEIQRSIVEKNRILKIRYNEVDNFYVYGQEANVLISHTGTTYDTSDKSSFNKMLMEFLQINAATDSQNTKWMLVTLDDETYIISWYAKNKKAIGSVMNLNKIFKRIQKATEGYQVIPFMEVEDMIIMPPDVKEEHYLAITQSKRNKNMYDFQLGSVGKINLYIIPGGGVLRTALHMQIVFVALIAILLILCVIVAYYYYCKVMEPLKKFVQDLEDMNEEQMLNENGENKLLELESASDKFRELIRKIQTLKIAIYEKELLKQQVELEYMQEQTKPHFFLNCLSIIHGIADTAGEKEIIKITEVLSEYTRYIFRDSEELRLIKEEIDHINAYTELQKLRYGEESFIFEVNVDKEVEDCCIPSLLLQALIENSIVHGVTLDYQIQIYLYATSEIYEGKECLYICISDTGTGFSDGVLKAIKDNTPIVYNGRKHVGLQNIVKRLDLIYGKAASITFSNMNDNYGAVVEVRIPIRGC